MQVRLSKTVVLLVGAAGKDAELKHVGDKNTPVCKFSLAVGKDEEDKTVWADCDAWQKLSSYAAGIKKSDIVLAIGTIKSREYNGKTYNTLECDFVCNPAAFGISEIMQNASAAGVEIKGADNGDFVELDGDGDLPF